MPDQELNLEDETGSVDPDPFPPTALERLRRPFPIEVVGILPQLYHRETEAEAKTRKLCPECGNTMSPHLHLDYVGHAAVTERLLEVDPEWTWQPMGVDERGVPALDADGNLWIWLTVCGVKRPGVGDGKTMKIKIGDAIRNAAMRFGVALYLWTKDELESFLVEPPPRRTRRAAPKAKDEQPVTEISNDQPEATDEADGATTRQVNELRRKLAQQGKTKDIDVLHFVSAALGREVKSPRDCTEDEMSDILRDLGGGA